MGGAERTTLLHRLCNFIRRTYICNSASVASNKLKKFTLKVDSGASHNFIASRHKNYFHNLDTINDGPSATLPNNEKITPTHRGYLPLNT